MRAKTWVFAQGDSNAINTWYWYPVEAKKLVFTVFNFFREIIIIDTVGIMNKHFHNVNIN